MKLKAENLRWGLQWRVCSEHECGAHNGGIAIELTAEDLRLSLQ